VPSDVLRPKSFAGLFGAAPSVALATLGIAVYQGAAALDAAGAALGALGTLGFAIVFSLTVESSILIAFIGASLAWLVVSGGLECTLKMRSVRKDGGNNGGSAVSRSRYG